MKPQKELKKLDKEDLISIIAEQINVISKLEEKNKELEKRLLAYENAHTPPSQQRRYPRREPTGTPPGASIGHKGVTRKTPEPTETKTLHLDKCPNCNNALKLKCIKEKIIEEIPNPQPLRVIKFLIHHYHCKNCNKKIIADDSELPKQGNLGNNLQAQISLMRYEDRLPIRKIANTLNRQYNLQLTPATILDVTRRVADSLAPEYNNIKKEISQSPFINADETGARLNGKSHWFWTFMNFKSVFFLLTRRREHKVVKEVLGENYQGILTCDGLKQYQKAVKNIQRCWAHLLRESKFLAQKHEEQAKTTYNSLCELFKEIKKVTIKTPKEIREKIYNNCIKKMQLFIGIANKYKHLRKLAVTMKNGLHQWFVCILHPEIEPTNNRAERELREFVVQRKIFRTFRSEKGLRITEIIMSLLATWRLRNLNTYNMLRASLSNYS
jgi:transposase